MIKFSKPNNLLELLYLHLDDDAFTDSANLIQPFFEYIRSGKFNLSGEKDLNVNEICEAISSAIDQKVSDISFLSIHKPFLKDFSAQAKISFREVLMNKMGVAPNYSLSVKESLMWPILKVENVHGRSIILNKNSVISIIVEMDSSNLKITLWVHAHYNLLTITFYYLGFTLIGKRECANGLRHLFSLLPKCIPLFNLKDKDRAWVVLSA